MSRKNKRRKLYDIPEFDYMPIQKTGVEGIRLINRFKPKNEAQKVAVDEIRHNTLTFLGGPAGTAKTFLAVSQLVDDLLSGKVQKGIISRPTIEAGNSLGHLPGEINNKMDPYLRPIYDCLEYFVGVDTTRNLIEDGMIEIVPFQFMRGRTFTDCFIILDESQNATRQQLKLALTRIGYDSRCVVTFDKAQIDLREKTLSSVFDVPRFKNRSDIGFYEFSTNDICRAPIVAQVLGIYEEEDA